MKRSKIAFLFFITPAFLIYTIFMFAPLILSLRYSVYSWTGYGHTKTFVGFANFIRLFTESPFNERFFNALTNNVKFFVITMVIQNVLALFIALLLEKELKGSKFFRTIFFAPTTISVVIVGFLWTLMYNPMWGIINKGLSVIGLEGITRAWLGDPSTALPAIAIANAWQYIGIPMMLFIAGMQSISKDVYEASTIDGCSPWQDLYYITLPLLKPVIFIVTILTFVGNFSAFEIVYAMQGSLAGPNYATDILGTFFYRTAFGSYGGVAPDMGLGAAIATCMFLLIGVVVGAWLKSNFQEDSV